MSDHAKPQWYLVQVASGREKSIKANVDLRIKQFDVGDQIRTVYVPLREDVVVRDGDKRTIQRNVYPGYILVRMVMTDDAWRAVRYTPGVIGFVSTLDEHEQRLAPVPLDDAEYEKIRGLADEGTMSTQFMYNVGDRIRIKEGPFEDFIGVVNEINIARSKIRASVSFLGRETPVELDFLQVEEA